MCKRALARCSSVLIIDCCKMDTCKILVLFVVIFTGVNVCFGNTRPIFCDYSSASHCLKRALCFGPLLMLDEHRQRSNRLLNGKQNHNSLFYSQKLILNHILQNKIKLDFKMTILKNYPRN